MTPDCQRFIQPGKPVHYDAIDLLRGFAAISVLVYHVIEFNQWHDFPEEYGLVWFKWGWMGVDIFYVISGFVVTLAALNIRERNPGRHFANFLEFMGRRVRRIAPLHYLTLGLFIALFPAVAAQPDFMENLITHLTFTHNLFPAHHRALNAANWTLGVEMQFYLALITAIPFVTRRNLKLYIGGAFLIAFIWRALSFLAADHGAPSFPEPLFVAATQLPGMADFFACGMLIAFFSRSEGFAALRTSATLKFCLFAAICIGAALVFRLYAANYDNYWHTAGMVIFFRSLLALLFSLCVILICSLELGPSMKKTLAPLLYLGVISYGIYLFHLPAVLLLQDAPIANIWKLALALASAIGAAALSWRYFESRFIKKH